jgi:signal transduction histidine kinase
MPTMSMTSEGTPTGGRDVWERWLVAWHALFVASLVFTTASALAQGDLTGSRPAVTAVILAALSIGYWLIFVRQRPWLTSGRVAVVYLLVVAALYAVLLRQSTAYFWLQPIIFSQVFWLTDVKRAIPLAALIWFIVVQYSVDLSGRPVGEQLGELIGPAIAIAFFVIFGAWIGAIVRQSEDRRELLERLAATRAELAERERETAVLEERERLSRELHDTLAQDLVSVVTHLQAADAAADPAAAAHHRAEAARMAHEGITETRRLVWALRPIALEEGTLVESLERTVERWRVANGVRATLTVTGEARPLHPDVEVALLRALQEGLANAARHAQAAEVNVTLSYLGDVVTLDVHDDGRGFDPGAAPAGSAATSEPVAAPGAGLGLRGMRERVERLGGSVAVESAPGEGTTVGVSLPAASAS